MRSRFAGILGVAAVVCALPAAASAGATKWTDVCRADLDVAIFSDSAPEALVDTFALSWVPTRVSGRAGPYLSDAGVPIQSVSEIAMPATPDSRGVGAVGTLTGRPYLFSLRLVSSTNSPPAPAGVSRMRADWRLYAAKGGLVFAYGSQTIDVRIDGGTVAATFSGRSAGQPFAARFSASCTKGALSYPHEVFGDGGDITFDVEPHYRGTFAASARGLVPAVTEAGTVSQDPGQSFSPGGEGTTSVDVVVPEGTTFARFSLSGGLPGSLNDLDLYLYRVSGETEQLVDTSAGPFATERIDAPVLGPGTYRLWIHGYATDGPSANFTVSTWIVGSDTAGNTSVTVTDSVTSDTPVPITLSFTGLAPATKYLGTIVYSGAVESGAVDMQHEKTLVIVETP
jgi:hypothetical protein